MTMASAALMKVTGVLPLLLLAQVNLLALTTAQSTTPSSSSPASSSPMSTMPTSATSPSASMASSATSSATGAWTSMPSTASATTPGPSTASATTPGPSTASATMPGPSTASATMPGTSTASATMAGPTSATASSGTMVTTSSDMPGAATSMASTMDSQTSGVTWDMGSAASWNTSMLSCPSFSCNQTDCSAMYMYANMTSCDASESYCQLLRQEGLTYVVGCTSNCAAMCANTSQINCTQDCCNSTGCLNSTFASMTSVSMATTPSNPGPATGATKTTVSVAPQTTADNRNRCHTFTCDSSSTCYQGLARSQPQPCDSSQLHCELKKTTVNSKVTWTAGCTTNCSGETWCKASAACHFECCNATVTSCLWLNGTMNVPSSATRGRHIHAELMAILICLLGILSLL